MLALEVFVGPTLIEKRHFQVFHFWHFFRVGCPAPAIITRSTGFAGIPGKSRAFWFAGIPSRVTILRLFPLRSCQSGIARGAADSGLALIACFRGQDRWLPGALVRDVV